MRLHISYVRIPGIIIYRERRRSIGAVETLPGRVRHYTNIFICSTVKKEYIQGLAVVRISRALFFRIKRHIFAAAVNVFVINTGKTSARKTFSVGAEPKVSFLILMDSAVRNKIFARSQAVPS